MNVSGITFWEGLQNSRCSYKVLIFVQLSVKIKRKVTCVTNPTTSSRGRLRLTIDVETLVSQIAIDTIRHSELDYMENQDLDVPPIDNYRLGNRDVFYVPNFLSVSDVVIVSVQYSFRENLLGRRGAVYSA